MTWIHHQALLRSARVLASLLALVAAGCGSGAIEGPGTEEQAVTTAPSGSSTPDTASSSSSGVVTSSSARERWRWGLPLGDTSPAEREREVYKALQMSCAAGQAELDENWEQLQGPTSVLIFQAGIQVCRGDRAAARSALTKAGKIGLKGINRYETVCKVYKATLSVLDQKDPETIACSAGELPPWPEAQDPLDDPRTATDESKTSTTSPSTTLRTGTTTTFRLSTTR